MKKEDVQTSYHQGHNYRPMLNVKNHLWWPEIAQRYRDDGHEFSGDDRFWDWATEQWESGRYDALNTADEIAREVCWEDAQLYADECWPDRTVKVYSAGRSGGWLVVHGLPDVDDWDAVDLGRWRKFAKLIRSLVEDEYPYQFVWHLHVNIYEPDVIEPEQASAQAGMLADADMLAQMVASVGL